MRDIIQRLRLLGHHGQIIKGHYIRKYNLILKGLVPTNYFKNKIWYQFTERQKKIILLKMTICFRCGQSWFVEGSSKTVRQRYQHQEGQQQLSRVQNLVRTKQEVHGGQVNLICSFGLLSSQTK